MKLICIYTYLCATIITNFSTLLHAAHAPESAKMQIGSTPNADQEKLTQWFEAVEAGNFEKVAELINQVDINAKQGRGAPALIWASAAGFENIVKLLLQDSRIDVNFLHDEGTALIGAACYGRENIVKLLLAVPEIDVNLQESNGLTALMYAAFEGQAAIVRLLLDFPKTNIKAIQARSSYTALMFAQKKKKLKPIAKMIEDKIQELQIAAFESILVCSSPKFRKSGNPFASTLCQSASTEANGLTNEPISAEELQNTLSTLESVIAQIGDNIVDGRGKTLLDKAFTANSPEIVIYLLRHAKDPRELLTRFPFEDLNPTTDLFKFCMKLAYGDSAATGAASDSCATVKPDGELVNPKSCAHCEATDCRKRCSYCKDVYYCSPECQKADWKIHKHACKLHGK